MYRSFACLAEADSVEHHIVEGLPSRATVRAGLQCPDSSASSQTTVKFGQDFQVGKVLYQKVRFLSEGCYRIF